MYTMSEYSSGLVTYAQSENAAMIKGLMTAGPTDALHT